MHVKEALIFRRSVLLSVIKLPVTFLSLTTTAPIQACVKHLQECHTVTSFRPSLHSNVIKSKGDFPSQLGRKADQVKATEYPLNPDTEMGEGRRVRVSVRRSMWVWERERVRETKRKREREKRNMLAAKQRRLAAFVKTPIVSNGRRPMMVTCCLKPRCQSRIYNEVDPIDPILLTYPRFFSQFT